MWLPVAQRELLVASRNARNYWFRLIAPGIGVLLLILAGAKLDSAAPSAQGAIIFRAVAVTLFIYSAFAGLGFTAEVISSERRDGTLQFLQLTGMRELDLVLGKTLANSIPGIFGFVAGAPILAFSFLLGGVTGVEFLRVTIILVGTLCLSLAIGIFASSQTPSSGAALKQTLGTLLSILCLGVVGLIYFGIQSRVFDAKHWAKSYSRPENRWLFVVSLLAIWFFNIPTGSPALILINELIGMRTLVPGALAYAVGITLVYAMAAYFLFAARPFSIPAVTEMTVETSAPGSAPLHRRALLIRRTSPFKWILAQSDAELILACGWAVIGGTLQFLANSLLYAGTTDASAVALAWGSFAITVFVYFLFARRTADFLVHSRRNGLLEVLLVTPLPWKELLVEHRSAFLRFAWFPASILMAGELLGQFAGLQLVPGARPPDLSILLVSTVLSYVCSLFATLWCAAYFALRTKSSTHAAIYTVLLVLIVPAVIGLLFPYENSNMIPEAFFINIVWSWIYVFLNGGLWALTRARLNSFEGQSPAIICDPRAAR